jgi:hypothetical protein
MTDFRDFNDAVSLLRLRIFDADRLDASKLHGFSELMADVAEALPPNFYAEAFEELESAGHLDPASSLLMGGDACARLSARGRAYVRAEPPAETNAGDSLEATHRRRLGQTFKKVASPVPRLARYITTNPIGQQVIAGLIVLLIAAAVAAVVGAVALWIRGTGSHGTASDLPSRPTTRGQQPSTLPRRTTTTAPTTTAQTTTAHTTTAPTTTGHNVPPPPASRTATVITTEGQTTGAYGLLISVKNVFVDSDGAYAANYSLDNGVGTPVQVRDATVGDVASYKRYRVRVAEIDIFLNVRFVITRRQRGG